jgi:hypothetical protein
MLYSEAAWPTFNQSGKYVDVLCIRSVIHIRACSVDSTTLCTVHPRITYALYLYAVRSLTEVATEYGVLRASQIIRYQHKAGASIISTVPTRIRLDVEKRVRRNIKYRSPADTDVQTHSEKLAVTSSVLGAPLGLIQPGSVVRRCREETVSPWWLGL